MIEMKEHNCEIYQKDCLEGLKGLPDNSVDLIMTSPPYADRRKNSYEGVHSSKYLEWFMPIAKEIYRVMKPTGSFLLNIKPHCEKGERLLYVMKLVIALKEDVGFRFTDDYVWTKLGVSGKFVGRFKNAHEPVYHFTKQKGYTHNPYSVATEAKPESLARYKRKACGESGNGSGFAGMRKEITSKLALPSNHLHIPQKSNQHTPQSKHPAVYPVELCDFFIKAFTEVGDLVVDPFTGSGSTMVSAINNGRSFIGYELEDTYIDICKERYKLI